MSMEGAVRADVACGHPGFCLADIGVDVIRVITTAIIGQNLSYLPGTAFARLDTGVIVTRFDRRTVPICPEILAADVRSR
jgi:hypothetical protein